MNSLNTAAIYAYTCNVHCTGYMRKN